MSQTGTKSKSTANKSRLEVIGYDEKDPLGPAFIVKSPVGHILKISDTFAEMYRLNEIAGSVLGAIPFFSVFRLILGRFLGAWRGMHSAAIKIPGQPSWNYFR